MDADGEQILPGIIRTKTPKPTADTSKFTKPYEIELERFKISKKGPIILDQPATTYEDQNFSSLQTPFIEIQLLKKNLKNLFRLFSGGEPSIRLPNESPASEAF